MRTKDLETDNLVRIPESALLALVLTKLKDKVLFPEKIESAKKYLKHINNKTGA